MNSVEIDVNNLPKKIIEVNMHCGKMDKFGKKKIYHT
jgi:hypothetical protein